MERRARHNSQFGCEPGPYDPARKHLNSMTTIPAGRINRLFGTGGSVMLTLYNAFPEEFTLNTPLFVEIDGLQVPLWCDAFERRGTAGAVAAFADFDNERRASELLGREFRIEEQPAEQDDEFYMEDLIGFAVTTQDGLAGTVTDYYDSDANPLFEMEFGSRRVLVPAAEEFIAHIDFERRMMRLVLPEGLLEIEE